MAFPILGEIEKLINERGPAAIMKERLALAADQYSALEKKLSDAELRAKAAELHASDLESENKSLRLNLQKAEEKIRNLEEKFIESHDSYLEEVEVKILIYISKEKSTTAKDISEHLRHGESVVQFHLGFVT